MTRGADERDVALGMSPLTVNPMGMPLASGSAALAAAPSTNVNELVRSREKSSGPQRPVEAAAVARPVQVETGVARHALHRVGLRRGPTSIGRPVCGNGATNVLKRSSNAIHLPSGDGTSCVALSLRTCSISSRPGTGDAAVGTPMLRSVYFSLRTSRT